jgi:hypothetical protein
MNGREPWRTRSAQAFNSRVLGLPSTTGPSWETRCQASVASATMTVMGSQRPVEDWSEDDLDMLLELPLAYVEESRRCHQTGCQLAALVMLAAAFESVLLGMVIAHEENLRADGQWPPQPSKVHLQELADLARKRLWLTDPAMDQVVGVLNKVRTMAAHPGAYVRGMRQVPDLDLRVPEGYEACFDIVVDACEQLFAATKQEADDGQVSRK